MSTNEIAAVRLDDGEVIWSRTIPPVNGMESHPGLEGPVTISFDVLFSGSWDGRLRALSTTDGKTLWAFDTARDFETVNGVKANGGSMGAVGQVVEDWKTVCCSSHQAIAA